MNSVVNADGSSSLVVPDDAKIESVPRKYVPLVRKYPHIKQLVKMRNAKVCTLSGSPLHLYWGSGRQVKLKYRGHEAKCYVGDFREMLNRCKKGYTEQQRGFSAVVVKTVYTPHINPLENPRKEEITRMTVDGKEFFVVLDELYWFTRAF